MRRVIGLVLAGLGTFLIVMAVLLPTWVSSQVIKFPLNEYESATLTASNASYFSASSLAEKTGVNLEATYTIKGDGAAGTSSTAVWDEYSYVYDTTNSQPVQQMTRRFAFDRKTAVLVDCCGANINGDSSIVQRGYVGYVFPIGTQKQTYDVFDTTLNRPEPFRYSGTMNVQGIEAYKFVETVAPVQVATQTVPGSLVGTTAASVTLPEYYQINLLYGVDPVTGALIYVDEHQTLTLRNPATGAQALLLFDADLITPPSTVASVVALDSSGKTKLNLIETVLPLIFGIVGVIALIAGILLARKPRADLAGTAPQTAADQAEPAGQAEPADQAEPAETEQRSVVPGLDREPPEDVTATVPQEVPAPPEAGPPGSAPPAG